MPSRRVVASVAVVIAMRAATAFASELPEAEPLEADGTLSLASPAPPALATPWRNARRAASDPAPRLADPCPFAGEVRLVWHDPAATVLGVAPAAGPVIEAELVRLLGELGLCASFRRAQAHELARPGELRVILLDRRAGAHGAPVLGATPTRFLGEAFVWVHVPNVRDALGMSEPRGRRLSLSDERRLGTALARVVAHEVVHVLAPAVPHGAGLMSARLDREALTGRIRVEPHVAVAVSAAASGPRGPAPADPILTVVSRYEEAYR